MIAEKQAHETSLAEMHAATIALNQTLGEVAKQVSAALEKFNADTNGHGVSLECDCDWEPVVQYHDAFGRYVLTKVRIAAKPIDLPSGHK